MSGAAPGAGKTTTIEILEGLLAADAGTVEVLGLRWGRDERQLRERLGIQLQETQFSDKLTVYEITRLFRSFYARGRSIEEVLAHVEVEAIDGGHVAVTLDQALAAQGDASRGARRRRRRGGRRSAHRFSHAATTPSSRTIVSSRSEPVEMSAAGTPDALSSASM